MKNRGIFLILIIAFAAIMYLGYSAFIQREYIVLGNEISSQPEEWNKIIASSVNSTVITVNIDGKRYNSRDVSMYMSDDMELMCSVSVVAEMFECAADIYNGTILKIKRGNDELQINMSDSLPVINGDVGNVSIRFVQETKGSFVSISALAELFGYEYKWEPGTNQVTIISRNPGVSTLPSYYNYEEEGRINIVKNQGEFGTCWAFASLAALESTLLPGESLDFSEDHMTLNNSYNLSQEEGGDYQMAIAYLASWQGPVLEKDDPYGDGITNTELKAVKHVQEVQIIGEKDYNSIKSMILKYGGVQSSIYAANTNSRLVESMYYNRDYNSYCYTGDANPNHDIVIIGWDDNFSRENFNVDVEGDGAFICRNSWGEAFGNNGDFYVSYYDTIIGKSNVAYTKAESPDNYENIYQSDLCGWVGQIGYGKSEAYFANVYTSKEEEELKAVSFYAIGRNTDYSIYLCENFENVISLSRRGDPVTSGTFENAGYYTVNLDKTIHLNKGQKYAIIVKINTPDAERPVAIEFRNDYQTDTVDISDGEGYVSLKGIEWENTEEQHQCNVCLKAFTVNAEE
ncbi:MAG: cell surface protein [Lachnospiraceae bacterium]|nr:cell surface protein [Lachnospiraceae bacterium]